MLVDETAHRWTEQGLGVAATETGRVMSGWRSGLCSHRHRLAAGGGGEAPDHGACRTLCLRRTQYFHERSVARRRNFNRDLVGFEFQQRFVLPDGIAGRLKPAQHLCTGSFGQIVRHADVGGGRHAQASMS